MAERLLIFFLFLTACSAGGPEVLLENGAVSVVRQPVPKDFDPTAFQQYTRNPGGTVLNGGAVAIVGHLAGTQVQWMQGAAEEFRRQSLVVALKPGLETTDPVVLTSVLDALDAQLVATGDTNQYVYLRAPGVTEDLILSTSLQPAALTQNAALYQLDTAGIHLTNDTGIPLRMDQEVIDFYLPALTEFFGMGIDTVPFTLEARPFVGVRLERRR